MGIEVLPAPGRWDDFASFMVPRKPGGRGCVCIAYRNSSLDMPGRIAHMPALCQSEPGPGVLAYVDGEVAGWCPVAPKSTYRALVNSRTIPHVQDEDAWSVHGLGDMAAGTASKPCDLLDRHAIVGQQRDERVPQVPGRPVPANPGPLANVLEHLPDVPRTQRCTGGRGEYPAGVLPMRSGRLPLSRLVHLPPGACTGGSPAVVTGSQISVSKRPSSCKNLVGATRFEPVTPRL